MRQPWADTLVRPYTRKEGIGGEGIKLQGLRRCVGFRLDVIHDQDQVAQAQLVPVAQHTRLVGRHLPTVQVGSVGAVQVLDLQYVAVFEDGDVLARNPVKKRAIFG